MRAIHGLGGRGQTWKIVCDLKLKRPMHWVHLPVCQ
jgi:hypothetical protein